MLTLFGNKLRSELDKALNYNGRKGPDSGTTQVVELGGRLISSGLTTNGNFGGDKGCHMGEEAKECIIAPDSDCRVTRSVYRTLCLPGKDDPLTKPSAYIGTTGRTLHSRQLEHKFAINNRRLNNALSKHQIRSHPNVPPRFVTEVSKGGIRFNVERFCYEGLAIEEMRKSEQYQVLNQRAEWGNSGLVRLNVETR